ncbi:unnamed protein product [Calypogeia fissa]
MASSRGRKNRPNRWEKVWILLRFLLVGFIAGFVIFHVYLPNSGRPPKSGSGGARYPDTKKVSNETILLYSQFNPRLFNDRERIQLLLGLTKSGKTNLTELMKLRIQTPVESPVEAAMPMSTPMPSDPPTSSWISPFMELNNTCFPTFLQISEQWLGHGDRLNPRMAQDLFQTLKKSLDQNAAKWRPNSPNKISNSTSNTTRNDGDGSQLETRYRSCAVVGNNKTLLTKSYGFQIDRNEMVIRVNNGEGLSNNATHVGDKTTLSFMNSHVFKSCANECICHKHYGEKVPIVLYISEAEHLAQIAKGLQCKRNKGLLFVTPSLFDAMCGAVIRWYSATNFLRRSAFGLSEWNLAYDEVDFSYSSGMQAVVLALGMCERVNLFGFGGEPVEANYALCYNGFCRDFISEDQFYDDLVHKRKIPFLTDAGFASPKVHIFR